MSDHTISCTIVNQTSGTMVLASTAPNDHTDVSTASGASSIAAGVTVDNAFTGWNNWASGCGGTVTYTMPNSTDVLVIAYNTSTTYENSYCIPMLRSADPSTTPGCDAYYCDVSGSVVSGQDNGAVTTVTVYDK